jgi:hypothetical protein
MRIGLGLRIAFSTVPAAFLVLALVGCGSSTPQEGNPPAIPVYNPDPKNPLSDVTLDSEYKNLDRIKAGTKAQPPAAK